VTRACSAGITEKTEKTEKSRWRKGVGGLFQFKMKNVKLKMDF
jgi:hypothetical protein